MSAGSVTLAVYEDGLTSPTGLQTLTLKPGGWFHSQQRLRFTVCFEAGSLWQSSLQH